MKNAIIFGLIPLILSIGLVPVSFEYGSGGKPDPRVCGDRLCNEVAGGKVAYERLGGILEENMDKGESTKNYSPLKQMKDGVAAEDVVCSEGKSLMERPSNKFACVMYASISSLENRDWELQINLDCDTVDVSNWGLPTNKHCGLNNFDKVVRFTQVVSRGDGPVHEFGSNPKDLSHLTVQWGDNEIPFDEFLKRGHVDGILVLQGDDIVFEKYLRMGENDRHSIQSTTKNTVTALIHEYYENGMLDPDKKVGEYIPEVGSGYADATIQNVMDMNVANSFSENYFDPEAEVWESEIAMGWKPDPENKFPSLKKFIAETVESDEVTPQDEYYDYKSMNTDVASWLIEEVTDEDFGELFEEKIYQHLGAEQDAIFTTDSEGFVSASGGLIMTLQDFGRYGQLWANEGVAFDGTQVIPKDWVNQLRTDTKGPQYPYYEGYRYNHQLLSDGNILTHQGWGGQNLFADPETKVVVLIFSSHTDASGVHPFGAVAMHDLSHKISEYLSE